VRIIPSALRKEKIVPTKGKRMGGQPFLDDQKIKKAVGSQGGRESLADGVEGKAAEQRSKKQTNPQTNG